LGTYRPEYTKLKLISSSRYKQDLFSSPSLHGSCFLLRITQFSTTIPPTQLYFLPSGLPHHESEEHDMATIPLSPNIYWIGVNDRTTDLFEGLWPITREGVSYNSYLIRDKKKAVIDLAKSLKSDDFFTQIAEITPLSEIDYIIINHMEPDHTGMLRLLKRCAPDSQIIATEKAAGMLQTFYGVDNHVRVVKDNETLSLGNHTLRFASTPFVHWPETMMTYEESSKILFSCDGFGGYGALQGALFDDQCRDIAFYEEEALRYYANIVAKFHGAVVKAIDKLSNVEVKVIAPSHGLVWRENPQRIIDLYSEWSSYGKNPPPSGVTLLYGSMYGNTERMMNAVAQGVADSGVRINIFDVTRTHVSYILPSLWVNRGVIVGSPTYEGKLFPPVAQVLDMAQNKSIRHRRAALFGSYGWSGGAMKQARAFCESLQWDIQDTVEWAGGPTNHDLEKGREFGARFARDCKA